MAPDDKPTDAVPQTLVIPSNPFHGIPVGQPNYNPPVTSGNENAPVQSGQVLEGVTEMAMDHAIGKK